MVEQVARLIGNRLAGGEAIFLPEVGSLCVAFHGARRLSKRTVQPPYRSVEFRSEEQGRSLPALIEYAAACDPVTARSVYDRWLAQVREGDTLTIVGVGTLKHRHFAIDDAFDLRLNPHGHAPVQLRRKRRFDWVLAVGIAAILLAAAGLGVGYYLKEQQSPVVAQHVAPVVRQTPEPSVETAPETETEALAESEPAGALQTEAVQSADTASDAAYGRMQPGRFYVVMGVFSTQENAERAATYFAGEQPAWNYRIYLFGSKFLLAGHVSESEEEARDFVRQNRTQFPDMWVHAAR